MVLDDLEEAEMQAIPIQTDTGETLFVAVSEDLTLLVSIGESGGEIAEDGASKMVRRLEDIGATISEVCRSVQKKTLATIGDDKPEELSLEFGIKLAGEAAIPFITSTSVEGSFKVTAKWNFSKK
jgi:hypothetical protein